MTRKTIAVDIDDVLAANAPAFIAYSNKKWGTNLTIEDYDEHWVPVWKVDQKEAERRATEYHGSGVFSTFKHFPEAKPVLQRLAKHYRLVITTSRRSELEKETLDWMDRYFGNIFEEIHFAGMWDEINEESHRMTKAELCKRIGADYLIDDQPKHCFAVAKTGIQTLLFGTYPWSRDIGELPPKVLRVKDWQEVEKYFDARS